MVYRRKREGYKVSLKVIEKVQIRVNEKGCNKQNTMRCKKKNDDRKMRREEGKSLVSRFFIQPLILWVLFQGNFWHDSFDREHVPASCTRINWR